MTRIAKTISQLAGRTTVEARGGVRSSSRQPPSRRWRDARRKPTGLEPRSVASAGAPYQGSKSTLVVGKFDNRSSYLRALFSDGVDRLGGQAKGILVTHLQQTGRFTVVEWDNLEEITRGGHQGSAAAAAERRGLRDCGRRGGVRPQGSR
jgi:hypothetical protein